LRRSPGFGITLWAETINGSVYLAETCSNPKSSNDKDFKPSIPEDLGKEAAQLLLEEICRVRNYKNAINVYLLTTLYKNLILFSV